MDILSVYSSEFNTHTDLSNFPQHGDLKQTRVRNYMVPLSHRNSNPPFIVKPVLKLVLLKGGQVHLSTGEVRQYFTDD